MSSHKKLLTIPDATLEKLRCALCSNYLNHLPVYTCKDIGMVCGRCPFLQESNPIRNEAYEIIAEAITFPCIYKNFGCVELLTPRNIADHEETCTYRQYFCPFMPSGCCPWQGPSCELLDHFEEKHRIFVLENSMFEIDFTTKYSENYIFSLNNHLFVIHKKSDINENLFWCSVSCVGSKSTAAQYSFQLELTVKENSKCLPYTFPPKEVQCFINPNIDKNVAVEIDVNILKMELNNPANIICTVIIAKTTAPSQCILENTAVNISSKTLVSVDSIEQDILCELECPICLEYMVPPIYQCQTGHSICGSCKIKVSECSLCKQPVQDIRNFGLEKITSRIKYHCKYRDFDCNFISTANDIKQHETVCKFGPYNCPFVGYEPCTWNGNFADIMEHVHAVHGDNVLEMNTVNVPFVKEEYIEDEDCFVFETHGEMFRLLYRYENEHFFWSVQLIGPPEDSEKFMFALDIMDNTNNGQRFVIKRKVLPLTPYEETFEENDLFLKVPLYLIEPMIDADLTYRIQIV